MSLTNPPINLIKPICIGSLSLPVNVFYAPLAGCSDYPFRKISSQFKPGLMFCEMVKMDALIRNDSGTFHLLDYSHDMHPIGGQICGSKPQIAGSAARIIEDLGFDLVDLNCGCPVDKVTKDGSGSGLLKNPQLIGEIISNMVAAVKIPVTLKIRAGWDETMIYAAKITRIAEQAGAKAICIHGRTRQQGYKGPANWDWIHQAHLAKKNIVVIGNGDLFQPQDALNMIDRTHCDAVLVSRGTLGQPWIVEDILALQNRGKILERSPEDFRKNLMQHFEYTLSYQSEKKALIDMRRIGCWYFKKSSGTRSFREAISHATSLHEVRNLIKEFPFEVDNSTGEKENTPGCGC